MSRFLKILICFVLVHCSGFQAPFLLADSAGGEQNCFETRWPHENSTLQPDPGLVFGRLDNGFRYVLLQNQEPKGRVAIYLDIQAGSLHETDEQRGVAHFLEHMLFNGSTHFPPGTLVDYFLSRGMSFGGDTNAHTTYDETIYKIFLPDNSREEMEEGLLVMADYGRGALLLESEIDRERGVILAEKRERDSAEYRSHVASMAFTMKGSRVVERMPIGILETLEGANRRILKDYYDGWYRPENMVLVMVGDFSQPLATELIKDRFATMANTTDRPACPDVGQVDHLPLDFFYHHDPELGNTEVAIESIWNTKPRADSFELQVKNIREYLGAMILRHRLEQLQEQADTPFTQGRYYSGRFLDRIAYASISASGDKTKWRESLALIEQTLRQALDFGFLEHELKRVKKELIAELEKAVLTRPTKKSRELARAIIKNINRNRVMMSPAQELKLFGPVVEKLSIKEVEKSFSAMWQNRNRLVSVSGNAEMEAAGARAVVQGQYEKSQQAAVSAPGEEERVAFPYLQPDGSAGGIAARQKLETVDGTRLVLANGVIVNLKKTDFEKKQIRLVADLGQGDRTEPRPGTTLLTGKVVNDSGTGRLRKSELAGVLAGSTVKMSFSVGRESFRWQGGALVTDQELLFQTLYSLLADPGLRHDAYDNGMDGFSMMYQRLESDISGAMQLKGDRFLGGGDDDFGLPTRDEFSTIELAEISNWYLPAVKSAPLEISIVGDFDEKTMESMIIKYLGALPAREKRKPVKDKEIVFPRGERLELMTRSEVEKGLLVVAWKSDDFWDIMRTRRLHLLAEIFSERLRLRIREKLGASYSPRVFNQSSRIYPGYGVIQARLIADPEKLVLMEKEVLAVAAELYRDGVTAEEMELAKGPMLTSLKDMVKTNGYWLRSVLSLSQRYPQQLQWPTSILKGFASISTEELSGLAKRYLEPGAAAAVLVRSQKNDGKTVKNDS
ncbi:MAG: insulinase family protein [Thermodesulfobacteriota bacterium]